VLLTPAEAAETLRISTRHVRRLVAAGRLPSIQVSERITVFDRDELDRFIAEARRPARHTEMERGGP
jgi:excisionase family DNA binding protein